VSRDPLVEAVHTRRAEIEKIIEELDLGYKLHCLATKRE
jgi:hypothetical protein